MSDRERGTVSRLLKVSFDEDQESDSDNLNLAERTRKRRKLSQANKAADYMDVRFILAGSNICESFFSKAGFANDENRQAMIPSNFESHMFLHVNDGWVLADVNQIIDKNNETDN